MFLSIILPVYNVENYLEECLNSCLEQDIDSSDYEIICVNDGSTDNCLNILKTYGKKHSNIIVIDKPNGGVSMARNKGLEMAKGDYVWFVDPDDFIVPNILQQLKRLAQNSDAERIKIDSYSFWDELNIVETKLLKEKRLKSNAPYKKMFVTRTLYKREYLVNNNILFLVGVHYGEDGMFNYQTLIYNPLTVESHILAYFYREHNASATKNGGEKLIARKFLVGVNIVADVLVENYNKKICIDETRWMVVYWIYAVMEKFSYLGEDYFSENFTWRYQLKSIPITDFELRRLDKLMHDFSKTHNYKKLVSIVKRRKRKIVFLKIVKNKKKIFVGYIKHPKRLLNKVLMFLKKD